MVILLEGKGSRQRQAQVLAMEHSAIPCYCEGMRIAHIVKGRSTTHLEGQRTAQHFHGTEEHVPVRHSPMLPDRHEIGQLSYPLARKETCDKNIGFWHIELPVLHIHRVRRSKAEKPAVSSIKQCAKQTRGVKIRQAAPINRAIFPDQRYGAEISNDAIIFNRLICNWQIW